MKNLMELDQYRQRTQEVLKFYGFYGDHTCGVFDLPYPLKGIWFKCVASSSDGWDHISVSLPDRCPTWEEMEYIKHAFFKEDETAMQLHVPKDDHRNFSKYCLHLWRPNNGQAIPRPPGFFVA
jgi:hypothetical protein